MLFAYVAGCCKSRVGSHSRRENRTLAYEEATTGQLSPVMDELPRDIVQALPVADSNGLQLSLSLIEHLVYTRSCTGAADGDESKRFRVFRRGR